MWAGGDFWGGVPGCGAVGPYRAGVGTEGCMFRLVEACGPHRWVGVLPFSRRGGSSGTPWSPSGGHRRPAFNTRGGKG